MIEWMWPYAFLAIPLPLLARWLLPTQWLWVARDGWQRLGDRQRPLPQGLLLWQPARKPAGAGEFTGMVPIMRLHANGEMQFERTLKRCMSSAMDFDRPTMPSFAAA